MELVESTALINTVACFVITLATAFAFKNESLRHQLRALRLLVGYITATLLTNIYLIGFVRSAVIQASLMLSAINVALLWAIVYKFWTKGE